MQDDIKHNIFPLIVSIYIYFFIYMYIRTIELKFQLLFTCYICHLYANANTSKKATYILHILLLYCKIYILSSFSQDRGGRCIRHEKRHFKIRKDSDKHLEGCRRHCSYAMRSCGRSSSDKDTMVQK